MKIISIIGTRPQYIKVKPVYDYCKANNIEHMIMDTNQHYSDSVSKNIIESLNLEIDRNLGVYGDSELGFISSACLSLSDFLKEELEKDDIFVITYGDTNSAFAAALTCYKLRVPFAHVEAGARCFNNKVPEEVNRIFLDSTSTMNFCTSTRDLANLSEGHLSGDMEYELLNYMDIEEEELDFGIMTVHRQNNMNKEAIERIFAFSEKIGNFILPMHHRLKNQPWMKDVKIPDNIKVVDPLDYQEMVNHMASCKYLISDSGGVLKTSAFFGKRILVLREEVGCLDVLHQGFGRICTFSDDDIEWIQGGDLERKKRFFLPTDRNPSEIIIEEIYKYMDMK